MVEPLLGAIANFDATLSPADSLASRYLLPAGVRLNVIRAGSGRISHEWFACYDPNTSLWKTCQGCLFTGLVTYSETFPKWGLMRSGRLYRRVPLVRPISEKGFSLLPTPNSMDGQRGAESVETKKARGSGGINLAQVAKLLPTATAHKRGYSGQAEKSLLCPSHAGGLINPEWLEHLQGFPIGWTTLEDSVTPSSHK